MVRIRRKQGRNKNTPTPKRDLRKPFFGRLWLGVDRDFPGWERGHDLLAADSPVGFPLLEVVVSGGRLPQEFLRMILEMSWIFPSIFSNNFQRIFTSRSTSYLNRLKTLTFFLLNHTINWIQNNTSIAHPNLTMPAKRRGARGGAKVNRYKLCVCYVCVSHTSLFSQEGHHQQEKEDSSTSGRGKKHAHAHPTPYTPHMSVLFPNVCWCVGVCTGVCGQCALCSFCVVYSRTPVDICNWGGGGVKGHDV